MFRRLRILRIRARRRWLQWTGRCTLCAGVRTRHSADCYHCATHADWCHTCNKRMNFGKLYGAGPEVLKRAVMPSPRIRRTPGGEHM